MTQLPLGVTEDDIYSFFNGVDVTGAYLAKNWLNRGTGIGFVTVSNYEQAFKVWSKIEQRMIVIGGKKIPFRDSKTIELAASCPTELTSTLISMYVREEGALDNLGNVRTGYGRSGYF